MKKVFFPIFVMVAILLVNLLIIIATLQIMGDDDQVKFEQPLSNPYIIQAW